MDYELFERLERRVTALEAENRRLLLVVQQLALATHSMAPPDTQETIMRHVRGPLIDIGLERGT